MKKNYFIAIFLFLAAVVAFPWENMHAAWGTKNRAAIVYQKDGEILQFKTARTPDGYTYMAWLEWNTDWSPAACLMPCMQLLDPDGNPLWGDDGIVLDSYPAKSYTSQNSLIIDNEGNAYLSWADSRSQVDKKLTEDDQRYDNFEPVIFKVNKKGEMLWGETGKTYDTSTYSMSPILYHAGGNIYATMYGIGAGSYIPSYFVRLDTNTGEIVGTPKSKGGQYIASEGTDLINVYASGSSTVAMRIDENLENVWSEPTQVAPYVNESHNNFPYNLVSDGQGGVIVCFNRSIGLGKWMPIVNYIMADGESAFGQCVAVTDNENNNNDYNYIVYNPQTENIFNVWAKSDPTLALYGQMMDSFGERLWTVDGVELAFKRSTTNYSFAPLSAINTKNDTYMVLYVDETNWMQDTMYLIEVDEEGNVISEPDRVGPFYQGIVNPSIYWDNDNLYIIYYNYTGDTYSVRAQMIENVFEAPEKPDVPDPDDPNPDDPDDTGVDCIGADGMPQTIYTVDGRIVKSIEAPGLYIVNGKKILK